MMVFNFSVSTVIDMAIVIIVRASRRRGYRRVAETPSGTSENRGVGDDWIMQTKRGHGWGSTGLGAGSFRSDGHVPTLPGLSTLVTSYPWGLRV